MDHVVVPLDIHYIIHYAINAMHPMFKIAKLVHKIIIAQHVIQVLISQLLEVVHALLSPPSPTLQTAHVFLVTLAIVFSVILITFVQHAH